MRRQHGEGDEHCGEDVRTLRPGQLEDAPDECRGQPDQQVDRDQVGRQQAVGHQAAQEKGHFQDPLGGDAVGDDAVRHDHAERGHLDNLFLVPDQRHHQHRDEGKEHAQRAAQQDELQFRARHALQTPDVAEEQPGRREEADGKKAREPVDPGPIDRFRDVVAGCVRGGGQEELPDIEIRGADQRAQHRQGQPDGRVEDERGQRLLRILDGRAEPVEPQRNEQAAAGTAFDAELGPVRIGRAEAQRQPGEPARHDGGEEQEDLVRRTPGVGQIDRHAQNDAHQDGQLVRYEENGHAFGATVPPSAGGYLRRAVLSRSIRRREARSTARQKAGETPLVLQG